ncbi:4-hydroxy-tetrahydrodipicolinate synthase [Fundidesulfovibrio butyratiphilus]
MQFSGALTALVTPFTNGTLDEEAYRALIEWQIEQGIHGLVPCGTTGESATLSHQEHGEVIKICVDQVKKRVPVLAGAGSNNTAEAIELTKCAKEAGADGALHITPYYNKPTQAGLIAHFAAVAKAVPFPMVVYNVPGRTSVNMLAPTVAALAKQVPDVVGIKEATGSLTQVSEVIEFCGPNFTVLSGDDFTALPTLAVGGHGVISVSSNVAPALVSKMCDAFRNGDLKEAQRLHYQLSPINRAMFFETNPVPAKTALTKMGRVKGEVRLPLVALSQENDAKLAGVLKTAGLI